MQEKVLDPRPKAEIQAEVTELVGGYDEGIRTVIVEDKKPDQPRRIKVELDNGRLIVTDAVAGWQKNLKDTINRFIHR